MRMFLSVPPFKKTKQLISQIKNEKVNSENTL